MVATRCQRCKGETNSFGCPKCLLEESIAMRSADQSINISRISAGRNTMCTSCNGRGRTKRCGSRASMNGETTFTCVHCGGTGYLTR